MIQKQKMDKKEADVPVLQIGKNGVTDSFIEELRGQLKKNKIVKVKMLKSSREDIDRKALPEEIAAKLKAQLVDARGYTFVLKKR